MFEATVIYMLLGAFAGIAAGLLGVGGGLIIVPVLVAVFQLQAFDPMIVMQLALGTSLATIVFTSLSSVIAHHRHGAVDWGMVGKMVPGMLLGAMLGAYVADNASGKQLKVFFAIFEFAVAVYMIIGAPVVVNAFNNRIKRAELFGVSACIGGLASVLGIGGGTLTVPYLCMRSIKIHKAVAISAACGLPIAVSGAFGFFLFGFNEVALPAYSSGFIYWPAWAGIVVVSLLTAPLGASLAHHLSVTSLKKVFAGILFIMALFIIYI